MRRLCAVLLVAAAVSVASADIIYDTISGATTWSTTGGLPRNRIILSAKVSQVQDLIACYSMLAERSNHALHLGLTEAGMGSKGIVASAAALAVLLQEGIGDTIRVSLTPEPGGDRTREVVVAQELLQSMGLRAFAPLVVACPGCGRTSSTFFQELADRIQRFLRDVDTKDLAVALKAGNAEVSRIIFQNMSKRSQETIASDIEYLHNVRMRDVEEAQQRIVDTIRRLEEEGELVISKGGKDEVIA